MNEKKALATQSTGNTSPERKEQARDIMQQLITEGLFAPDEAAEITFSDTTVICTPEQQTGSDQNEKPRNSEIPGSSIY